MQPNYHTLWRQIEKLLLDPAESRRDELLGLIENSFPINVNSDRCSNINHPIWEEPAWAEKWPPNIPDSFDNVRTDIHKFLNGMPLWNSPLVAHNVNPPALLPSIAAGTITNLYNPNMIWDLVSGGSQSLERKIIKSFSILMGWSDHSPGGAFTFGGKACFLYAIQMGLKRVFPDFERSGLPSNPNVNVVSSKGVHYSLDDVCSMVGLGKKSSIRIDTLKNDQIDTKQFQLTINELFENKVHVPLIVLSGGNTLDMAVDPIHECLKIINAAILKHNIPYRPFVYLDSVLGWPFLHFKEYDFEENPLNAPREALSKVKSITTNLKSLNGLDGMGVDFHKLGFCSYANSLFICKSQEEFSSKTIGSSAYPQPYGNNFMQSFTIEHSRSAAPVISAWVALKMLGVTGLQSYILRLMELGTYFTNKINTKNFEITNCHGNSWATVFYPKFPDGPSSYHDLLNSPEQQVIKSNARLFAMFNKLAFGNDQRKSILLRYLPQYELASCGIPAGTLVYFPMALSTEEADIEYILTSIEEVMLEVYSAEDCFLEKNMFSFKPPYHVPK